MENSSTKFLLLLFLLPSIPQCCLALRIMQIVPGFTNSHVLFNYRLAETLTRLGHNVTLWTQMEMAMVFTGDFKLPDGVNEIRVPIQFKDRLKIEGLKVFQEMIFASGTPYELWWTGREFKDMRLEACEQMLGQGSVQVANGEPFDLAIGHFHDFCPVALAQSVGVNRLGLGTSPAFAPHPLSSNSDRMTFTRRLVNVLWHLSGIEFVNLPHELLHEENQLYRRMFPKAKGGDLWQLGSQVNVLLLNGERFLDFPRPFPPNILHLGTLGSEKKAAKKADDQLEPDLEAIYKRKGSKGVILFSMGTVSNTTNMPSAMTQSFLQAFGQIADYDFIWKTEQADIPGASKFPNVHLRRWIPQKTLIRHPRTALLLAHGGYNSFLEAAQAGKPVCLVPLFADQHINAERAKRFGIAQTLDKFELSPELVAKTLRTVLADERHSQNAAKLSKMLADKPPSAWQMPSLEYALKLAIAPRPEHFALKAAQQLTFFQHFGLDLLLSMAAFAWLMSR